MQGHDFIVDAIFIADNQLLSYSWKVREFQVIQSFLYLPNLMCSVLNSLPSQMKIMSSGKEAYLVSLTCPKIIARIWITCKLLK